MLFFYMTGQLNHITLNSYDVKQLYVMIAVNCKINKDYMWIMQ
jgi:hypothetical protein